MSKKVLIVLNSSWYAYTFRMSLARFLTSIGYHVSFAADADGVYDEKIKQEFSFYPIPVDAKGLNPLRDTKTILKILNLYRKVKPHIVLTFTIKPNIYSPLCSSLLRIPSIANITGLGTVFIKETLFSKIVRRLYRLSLALTTKVFFQNNDDRTLFHEKSLIELGKTDLLPGSGVDIKKFDFTELDNRENNNLRFLLIARVIKDKGIFEYIEAIRIVKQKYPEVKFFILGELNVANRTAISKDKVHEWEQEGLIEHLGLTEDVASEIKKVDCVVLPSYREGTPRSLLEAASMGRPIVTTDVPGCREVVDDHYNGFLCEAKNGKDLADKLIRMIDIGHDKRAELGKNSRSKIENCFREEIVFNKYKDALEEFLQ